MDFANLMLSSKAGNQSALEQLFFQFRPYLAKKSILNGTFEEDLFQMQCETFLRCVKGFRVDDR